MLVDIKLRELVIDKVYFADYDSKLISVMIEQN